MSSSCSPLFSRLLLLGCIAGMTLCSSAQADMLLIDTTSGSGSSLGFGKNGTTLGQVLSVEANTPFLTEFSMFIEDNLDSSDPLPLDFEFHLAEWDGDSATGALLFSSGMVTTSNTAGFNEYAFSPNIELTPGTQYIAFASSADFIGGPTGAGSIFFADPSNGYAGGDMFLLNHGSNFNQVFNSSWTNTFFDMQFTATFSSEAFAAVPDVSSLLLLGSAAAVTVVRRRRKQSIVEGS